VDARQKKGEAKQAKEEVAKAERNKNKEREDK
jgi:hypothetical protein